MMGSGRIVGQLPPFCQDPPPRECGCVTRRGQLGTGTCLCKTSFQNGLRQFILLSLHLVLRRFPKEGSGKNPKLCCRGPRMTGTTHTYNIHTCYMTNNFADCSCPAIFCHFMKPDEATHQCLDKQ